MCLGKEENIDGNNCNILIMRSLLLQTDQGQFGGSESIKYLRSILLADNE